MRHQSTRRPRSPRLSQPAAIANGRPPVIQALECRRLMSAIPWFGPLTNPTPDTAGSWAEQAAPQADPMAGSWAGAPVPTLSFGPQFGPPVRSVEPMVEPTVVAAVAAPVAMPLTPISPAADSEAIGTATTDPVGTALDIGATTTGTRASFEGLAAAATLMATATMTWPTDGHGLLAAPAPPDTTTPTLALATAVPTLEPAWVSAPVVPSVAAGPDVAVAPMAAPVVTAASPDQAAAIDRPSVAPVMVEPALGGSASTAGPSFTDTLSASARASHPVEVLLAAAAATAVWVSTESARDRRREQAARDLADAATGPSAAERLIVLGLFRG
jgi:hypothetical protein